jgi:hypothetical protein
MMRDNFASRGLVLPAPRATRNFCRSRAERVFSAIRPLL